MKNVACYLFALLFCLHPIASLARDAKEDARIEHLIDSIRKLKGAVFIRNGTEHDAEDAANHLRLKLRKAGKRITTAQDFIDALATKSSLSGKPYQIRKVDGSVVSTRQFFQDQLLEYKKANP